MRLKRYATILCLSLSTWLAPLAELPPLDGRSTATAQAHEAPRDSARARAARAKAARRRAAAARARRARLARQRRARAAQRAEAAAAAAAPERSATPEAPSETVPATAAPSSAPPSPEAPLPDPASLSEDSCLALLDAHGVRYRRVASSELPLIVLEGPIAGIEIAFVGRNRVHAQLDCRVAAAVLAWAPTLRAAAVRRIRHLSIHRPGATVDTTGRPSGHSAGLAMDVRYLDLDDGRTLDVLVDWGDRTRDATPCPADAHASDPSTVIRALVCAAVEHDLFETVITPHHDEPHQNHVHVEVVPGVTWRFVR